jgi:hypothetical protein
MWGEDERNVMQMIEKEGPIRSTKLAEKLNIDLKYVTNLVRNLRRKFNSGKIDSYIYTTPDGYSLDESKRAVIYETNMRLSQMFGMAVNSHFIRHRCKVIALKDFKKLSIVYKPRLLTLENELK